MDIQLIIVTIIVVGAVAYAANMVWRKSRSVVRPSCNDDCGCSSSKAKTLNPRIE